MNNKTAASFCRFCEKQGRVLRVHPFIFSQFQMLSAIWCRVDIGLLFSKPLAVMKCQAENALCLQARKSLRFPSSAVSLLAYSWHGKQMNPDSWFFFALQQQWRCLKEWGKVQNWMFYVITCIFPLNLFSASFFTPLAKMRWVGISKERERNNFLKSQFSS